MGASLALETHCRKNCNSTVSAVLTSGLPDVPHRGARQLGHSSSAVQRGWVGVTTGGGHLPHSRLDAVLWHALPLDSGEGLSSSERAVYFVIEQIVHSLS